MKLRLGVWLPLAGLLALAVLLAGGLGRDAHTVPSPFIDKPLPAFAAPVMGGAAGATRRSEDLRGQVWVLNVWASWCAPCREEHPLIVAYAKRPGAVRVLGLNYKDAPGAAQGWLAQLGNPYAETLIDADGRLGIELGVYGVPETFVIDKAGLVRFKHVGPLTPEVLEQRILPLLKQLNA